VILNQDAGLCVSCRLNEKVEVARKDKKDIAA